MKKIMMTKFGFDRWPEESFSDDGNRFESYRAGKRVRVTKCVSDGVAYIDGNICSRELPYAVYSKLPHYLAISKLNGIKIEDLTEDMLTQLYFDCVEYEKEYDAAMASMVWPTEAEIRTQCLKVQFKAKRELADIEHALSGKAIHLALTLKDWEWKIIREYINNIDNRIKSYDPAVVVEWMMGTASSIDFCKPNNPNLADSYYYTHIMELINK
jgi:hypothetical protein